MSEQGRPLKFIVHKHNAKLLCSPLRGQGGVLIIRPSLFGSLSDHVYHHSPFERRQSLLHQGGSFVITSTVTTPGLHYIRLTNALNQSDFQPFNHVDTTPKAEGVTSLQNHQSIKHQIIVSYAECHQVQHFE